MDIFIHDANMLGFGDEEEFLPLFFLCSLNVPMISLWAYREAELFIGYIFSLFVMLIYSKKLISDRAYAQTKLILYVLISVAAVFFAIITIARFGAMTIGGYTQILDQVWTWFLSRLSTSLVG